MAKTAMQEGLTMDEYSEMLCLEYILTWRYTNNLERDTERYVELSNRKWNSGLLFNWQDYFNKIYSQTYNS